MARNYTIERLTKVEDFTEDIKDFIHEEVPKISEMFGNDYDYTNCNYYDYALNDIFLICRRDGEVRGMMIGYFGVSGFDSNSKILRQQLFYVKPGSGRTAYHLFNKFIDIGRNEANHIITMLTSQTNIKAQTLENMGFEEMETLYMMRCKDG